MLLDLYLSHGNSMPNAAIWRVRVFEVPQVPLTFEFESERPKYQLPDLDKVSQGLNGNLATKQLPNYYSVI